jgi:WD40 repeat protein
MIREKGLKNVTHGEVPDLRIRPANLARRSGKEGSRPESVWSRGETGQEIVTFKGQKGKVQSVAFSRDGKRLASGGDGREVKL